MTVFSSALCFHTNIPKMVRELKYPKTTRFATKVHKMFSIGMTAAVSCTLLYYTVGAFAYFAFGNEIAGNLLTNFQHKGYWYLGIVKFAYALVVIFSNPVVAFPSVCIIDRVLFTDDRTWYRRLAESLLWCTLIWFIATLVPQLDVVFSFTGATGGILLLYVLPSIFYIAVVKRVRKKTNNTAASLVGPSWLYYAAHCIIAITLIEGCMSITTQIQKLTASPYFSFV